MSRSRQNSSHALAQRSLLGDLPAGAPARRRGPRSRRLPRNADVQDGFTTALKLVVEYGRLAREQMEGSAKSRCPRCGRLGPTGRNPGSTPRNPEALCRACQQDSRTPAEGELFALPGAPESAGQ